MSVFAWKRDDGVIGVSYDHWYGGHLQRAMASERERQARDAELARSAPVREAHRQPELQERAERVEAEQARRAALAKSLLDKPVAGCAAFERGSNALLTRVGVGMTLDEFRRHVSDTAVA